MYTIQYMVIWYCSSLGVGCDSEYIEVLRHVGSIIWHMAGLDGIIYYMFGDVCGYYIRLVWAVGV